jgi:two-component system phosphate regulon response regulator PhoB
MHPGGRPVLIVEDHEDTRQMVEMFLQQEGYRVCTAGDGAEALACVIREPPCMILLDLTMPIMDGLTFARRLRESPDPFVANTPIVLLTAVLDPTEAMRLVGAVDLIPKPISFLRVIETVARHCPGE